MRQYRTPFSTTYQVFNQAHLKDIRTFLADNNHTGIRYDSTWVQAVWRYCSQFPVPSMVYDRIEHLWQPLCHYGDMDAIQQFITSLENFIEQHELHDELRLVERFRDDLKLKQHSSN